MIIAIKKKHSSKLINIEKCDLEILFVEVKFNRQTFILGTVYLPPDCSPNDYLVYSDVVGSVLSKYKHNVPIFLIGDFNCSNIFWDPKTNKPTIVNYDASADNLVACTEFHDLFQLNQIVNIKGSILDLVLTNKDNSAKVYHCDDCLLKIDNLHPPLLINIKVKKEKVIKKKNNHKSNIVRDYKSDVYNELSNYYTETFQSDTFIKSETNINILVDNFYAILNAGIEQFIPLKTVKPPKFPIWFSEELKNLIFEKKQKHKDYKSLGHPHVYTEFSSLRKRCKVISSRDYSEYIKKIEKNVTKDPKRIFDFISSKKDKGSLPEEMSFENTKSNDPKIISNLFAKNFSKNYSTLTTDKKEFDLYTNYLLNINSIEITEHKVLNALCKLPERACKGPDEIPSILFVKCAASLAAPLAFIFQISLNSGVFPSRWKKAYITPIFKPSGNKESVKDYRPVCISSILPKLLENLVSQVLYPLLSTVINDEQHGFMKSRSTATNLISFSEFIADILQKGGQVDCVYTDFSKCFDRLNHNILISKLKAIGIGGKLLDWLESFHSNREQIVKIISSSPNTNNNHDVFLSDPISVPSGCIQGGHLSGILFLCYINDIISILSPNVRGWLFADDLKIAMRVDTVGDVNTLQETVRRLHCWCSDNLMNLNLDKCKVMTFHTKLNPLFASYNINNTTLSRVYNIRDLGVIFEPNLKFNLHHEAVKRKSLSMLGLLYRHTQDFKNPNTIKNLYYTYVRSRLEYCCTVWSPQYDTHAKFLESVQHKFLRILAYKTFRPIEDHNYDGIMSSYDILSLKTRRDMQDLIFIYKILNNLIYSPELLSKLNLKVKTRQTRSKDTFVLGMNRTNLGEHSPLHRMQKIGNVVGGAGLDLFHCTQNDILLYFSTNFFSH